MKDSKYFNTHNIYKIIKTPKPEVTKEEQEAIELIKFIKENIL